MKSPEPVSLLFLTAENIMTGQTFSHPQDISTGLPHEAAQADLKEWHRIVAERGCKKSFHKS